MVVIEKAKIKKDKKRAMSTAQYWMKVVAERNAKEGYKLSFGVISLSPTRFKMSLMPTSPSLTSSMLVSIIFINT